MDVRRCRRRRRRMARQTCDCWTLRGVAVGVGEGQQAARTTRHEGHLLCLGRLGMTRRDRGRPRLASRKPHARPREEAQGEVVAGLHPVREALLAESRPIGRLLVAADRHDSRSAEILRLGKDRHIPIVRVPTAALDRLVPRGVPHQGVVAEVGAKVYVQASELLEGIVPGSLFLALDEVQDPRNLGAILRTAAAAGVSGVVIPERRSASLTPGAVKAAAGGVEAVRVARAPSLIRVLEDMGEAGVLRVGLDPTANDLYTAIPASQPIVLVLGGEEKGLRRSVLEACDLLVRIPLLGKVASLNVSVAAGIALYEVLRVRSLPDSEGARGGRA